MHRPSTVARSSLRLIIAALGTLIIVGCGGGGGGDSPAPTQPAQPSGIGAAGGTVSHASGASVVIPAGALSQNVAIVVAQSNTGAPALPAGLTPIGSMFAFTPHGTSFATPVTITLPFDPSTVPSGRTPALYKTNAQNAWERVSGAAFGSTLVTASITSFSHAQIVIEPLLSTLPIRNWAFMEYVGDDRIWRSIEKGTVVEGGVFERLDFGPASFDEPFLLEDGTTQASDGIATGRIFSSPDGVTYWVGAEAPRGNSNLPERIGVDANLETIQTFIKQASNATYSFTISSVYIDVRDDNGIFQRPCPPKHGSEFFCAVIRGLVFLQADATPNEPDPATGERRAFFSLGGGASLTGLAENWHGDAYNVGAAPFWSTEDFDFLIEDTNGPEGHVRMTLRRPMTINVDLSSLKVGEAFTMRTVAVATTWNHIAGPPSEFPNSVSAYFRDPSSIGGTSVVTTGLLAIQPVQLPATTEVAGPPASCTSQTNPSSDAGVIQFSAASFATTEASSGFTSMPVIYVTRTGGDKGLVTATFSTADGTGIADTDYTSVSRTVTFGDGDSQRRAVIVQPIDDAIGGEPDKTVNLALSQPGGCAALGTQTTAVLNIRDNDPPPPAPSGLDTSFDGDGKVSTAFGGDETAMAVQPDGKIVLVGGSTSDFVLARYNVDGSLDATFDGDGLVTTSILSGITEESARGVAIQSDGKILVAGYTGVFGRPGRPAQDRFDFAVVRYNANGSLDTSFGTGGIVNTGVIGRAFALALQSDGKIVVAGDAPLTQDFRIARYNTDGTLDASFDGDGQVTTDVEGGGQFARNILVQANGSLLVTGPHSVVDDFSSEQHTALARFTNAGALDTSFSGDGRLLLTGMRLGEDAALQPDGKILLTGNSGTAPATQFATLRLNADGSTDTSFGTAGVVSTPITQLGDGALALALQSDGKIVVAGSSSRTTNSNFAVVRYTSAGAVDSTFLGDGSTTVDFFGFRDRAENVVIQPNGRIVLGGIARNTADGYGLVRIVP